MQTQPKPFLDASCSDEVIPIAWISRLDTRSYAGFLWWLAQLGEGFCAIIDVTGISVGEAGTKT